MRIFGVELGYPCHPWDERYIYSYIWLIFVVNYRYCKYTTNRCYGLYDHHKEALFYWGAELQIITRITCEAAKYEGKSKLDSVRGLIG